MTVFAPDTIKRVELGRAPLKYELACLACSCLDLNPFWLATGIGEMAPHVPLPIEEEIGIKSNALFSRAFDEVLGAYLEPFLAPGKMTQDDVFKMFNSDQVRSVIANNLEKIVDAWLIRLPESSLVRFTSELVKFGSSLVETLGRDSWEKILSRRQRSLRLREFKAMAAEDLAKKKVLTDVTVTDNIAPVKSPMANLLDRLNHATARRGMKTVLAKVMRVPLANVSQWLSGEREPGGETTLRLLHWVQKQEEKLNDPSSAINTTGVTATRPRKTLHENQKSNPRKK